MKYKKNFLVILKVLVFVLCIFFIYHWKTAYILITGPKKCSTTTSNFSEGMCIFDSKYKSTYKVISKGFQPQIGCSYNLKIMDPANMEGKIDARLDKPKKNSIFWKSLKFFDKSKQYRAVECPRSF